jgi:hypothetical protein
LNHLEVYNPSAPDQVEDVRRTIFMMVPTAIDRDEGSRLHLLAIFRGRFLANATIPLTITI